MLPQPDRDGLLWGYAGRGQQWVARRSDATIGPNPGKWIAFLPTHMPDDVRRDSFARVARAALTSPVLEGACFQAKLLLSALYMHPDRVAVTFHADVSTSELVLDQLQKIAREERRLLMKEGWLRVRDGYWGGWVFKTDAQTKQELKTGRHPAQISQVLQWAEEFFSVPGDTSWKQKNRKKL